MNDLQVFNYGKQEVRTVLIDENPWWVLADVCRVLGITNSRNAAARLDEDEKGVRLVDALEGRRGGRQRMTVINESGLYSVILRSDKEEAKAFKRWITHEVLPAIRKTGRYETQPTFVPLSSSPPISVEIRLQRAELLLRAAELKTNDLTEQRRLVDLAVRDLTCEIAKSPIAQPAYPALSDKELSKLPERIGIIKNAGVKRCGDVNVPLYTLSEIADMVGVTAAEFDKFADKHRLKTPFNGEWVTISTPQGNAREFLYMADAVRFFRKEGN